MRTPIVMLGVLTLASSAAVLLSQAEGQFARHSLANASVRTQTAVRRSVPAMLATAPTAQTRVSHQIQQLPLGFEVNRGQANDHVKFLSRSASHTLFLTPTEADLQLPIVDYRLLNEGKSGDAIRSADRNDRSNRRLDVRRWTMDFGLPFRLDPLFELARRNYSQLASANPQSRIRMQLVGANARANVTGLDELPGKVNYLVGSDLGAWKTDIPTYAKVRVENVYSGIDLVYYGNPHQLEYDFIVAPGADPQAIALNFSGADHVEVDSDGDLQVKAGSSLLLQHRPVIYQEVEGKEVRLRQICPQGSTQGAISDSCLRFEQTARDRSCPQFLLLPRRPRRRSSLRYCPGLCWQRLHYR
jgi:hypothetical protein